MNTGELKIVLKRKINVVFCIMIALSVCLSYSFFKAWNRPKVAKFATHLPVLKDFHIDSCIFGKKDITVYGWAFVSGNSNILNRIYAENKSGEWIELMNSTIPRGDVSAAYKSPLIYDRSGFMATRRDNSSQKDFTREIMITSLDKQGLEYASKYKCQ